MYLNYLKQQENLYRGAMEAETIQKNAASPKKQMRSIGIVLFIAIFFCSNYVYPQTQNCDPKDELYVKLDTSDRVNVGYIVSNNNNYPIKVKLEITVKLRNGKTKSVLAEGKIEKKQKKFFSGKIEKSDVILTETKYKVIEVKDITVTLYV
jgi:hypothetical protein